MTTAEHPPEAWKESRVDRVVPCGTPRCRRITLSMISGKPRCAVCRDRLFKDWRESWVDWLVIHR